MAGVIYGKLARARVSGRKLESWTRDMKGPVSEGCQPCQWTGLQPSRWSHFLLETAGSVKFGLAYKTFSNLARLSLSGKKKKKRQYRTKEGSYIVRRPKNVRNMNHEGGNSHAESPELCFFPGKPTSLQILKAPFLWGSCG